MKCFINALYTITGDKLTILSTLINQLLSYASLRDIIDEAMDSYKSLSYELKQIQWAEQRRDREEAQLKHKKRLEQKIQQQQAQAAQLQQQKYECIFRVSHNASVWNSQVYSVNESIFVNLAE